MPVYDYVCRVCDKTNTIERSIHAEADSPECCGTPMDRVFSNFGIIFKGGGFYSTGG